MEIKSAKFLITVAEVDKILTNRKNEFAFVGRSNVGKSSLINALTKQSRLAKTSSMPGLTKNINYFDINNGALTIVDLPGYGYHKAGKAEEEKWSSLLEGYLLNSKDIKCVFVLADIRHESSELDKQMIRFLNYYQIPFVVIATKSDKLKKTELNHKTLALANSFGLGVSNLIVTSSEKRDGLNAVLSKMDQFIK